MLGNHKIMADIFLFLTSTILGTLFATGFYLKKYGMN